MKLNFKFKTQTIAFVYAMLVAVFFIGCKKHKPVYETKKKQS